MVARLSFELLKGSSASVWYQVPDQERCSCMQYGAGQGGECCAPAVSEQLQEGRRHAQRQLRPRVPHTHHEHHLRVAAVQRRRQEEIQHKAADAKSDITRARCASLAARVQITRFPP